MKSAKIYQDNKSTILLKNNGKFSSSKRTKHIKHKYFFATNKIEEGEVSVEYKPTAEMWTDINNKSKQGRSFCVNRSLMMNCPVNLPPSIWIKSI